MADQSQNSPSSPSPIKNLKFLGLVIFAGINITLLLGAAWMIFKATLGFKPPLVLESELKKLSEQRLHLIKEGQDETSVLEKKPSSELPSFNPLILPMDEIVTNLSGEPKRIVKALIHFKVLDDLSYQEILDPNLLPKIRDAIITTFQNTSFSDMESLQGKLFLKDRILKAVNPLLKEGVIREVYFIELVVQ
jgi:flagellar protein FliL